MGELLYISAYKPTEKGKLLVAKESFKLESSIDNKNEVTLEVVTKAISDEFRNYENIIVYSQYKHLIYDTLIRDVVETSLDLPKPLYAHNTVTGYTLN